jgi:hypothetical protein
MYEKAKKSDDILFRLRRKLRNRVWSAIRLKSKSGSAVRDLGCSVQELSVYVASFFHSGMSWDNWGSVWHLDHIKPLASFDLTQRAQFLRACHYTNMQPLLIADHVKKTAEERKQLGAR